MASKTILTLRLGQNSASKVLVVDEGISEIFKTTDGLVLVHNPPPLSQQEYGNAPEVLARIGKSTPVVFGAFSHAILNHSVVPNRLLPLKSTSESVGSKKFVVSN